MSVIAFISLYSLFYQGLSFDGALHSQAAINLYDSGNYKLDYPIGQTQIKVPFQVVNGFFLTLFGKNFVAANLANVVFFILFGIILFKLSNRYSSQYLLLGLITLSFSPGLLALGFKGYGEVAALGFGLFGIMFITKSPKTSLNYLFGGLLIS